MGKRIIILLMILMPVGLSAQQVSREMTQSPDVAALAKYIDYPVSYATGVPEISIPLYTIKTKEFTLPITLSYHASGIKIMDVSGFVGLGWTLNAEPSITRTVKGKYDEEHDGYIMNYQVGKTDSKEYFIYVVNGLWDEQPDVFYYKLLNKSGKFMFWKSDLSSTTATPIPMPYEPILILMDDSKNFVIKDDDGAQYNFCKGETSYDNGEQPIVPHTNSWEVSKIVAAQKNDSLLFNYYTFQNPVYRIPTFEDKIVVEDQYVIENPDYTRALVEEQSGFAKKNYRILPPYGEQIKVLDNQYDPFGGNMEINTSYNNVYPEYIKEIVLPDGQKVCFNADATGKLLTSISIPGGKMIRFYYGFLSKGIDIPGRTRLDSVVFSDNQNVSVERYKFSYISGGSGIGIPYPGFGDWRSKDYWGYYNGAAISDTLCAIPKQTISLKTNYPQMFSISIGIDQQLRAINEADMKLWTLNEIDYPTGGKTLFDYEANRYINTAGVTNLTGGLRVKTIQNYDPVSQQTITRNFSYDQPIYCPYTMDDFTYTKEKVISGPGLSKNYSRVRTYVSSPLVAYTYNGSPVVYNKVTETRGDNGGGTKYYYDYISYFPFHETGTTIVIDPQIEWQFRDKVAEEHFRGSNPDDLILKKSYEYKITSVH